MAVGVQCFDTSGNLLVDITSRLGRFSGSASISGAAGSVAVTVPGTLWYAFQPTLIWGFANMNTLRPNFSVSGSTISWTYPASAGSTPYTVIGTLFYGVY
jgi:hypothetical protein